VEGVFSHTRESYYARRNPSLPKTHTDWKNRARKLTSGLLSSSVRKGGNFNEPDDAGHIPLLGLAKLASPQRNLLNMGSFAELALGTSPKRVSPDWSLMDQQGNTALHLLFSSAPQPTEWRQKSGRRGRTVQEFARSLCRATAATEVLLSEIDLLAVNHSGESIIHLIADHCLRPRSRRADEDRFGYRYHGMHWDGAGDPVMPPERFPNCLRTHEKLFAAWMQLRAPLVKSVQTSATTEHDGWAERPAHISSVSFIFSVLVLAGASWRRI
jgi:hypothetical protein